MMDTKYSVTYTVKEKKRIVHYETIAKDLPSRGDCLRCINVHIDKLLPKVPELFDSLEIFYPTENDYQCEAKNGVVHYWRINKKVSE